MVERGNFLVYKDINEKTKTLKRQVVREAKAIYDEALSKLLKYPTVVIEAALHRSCKTTLGSDKDQVMYQLLGCGIDELTKIFNEVQQDYDAEKVGLELKEVIETETKTDNNVPF